VASGNYWRITIGAIALSGLVYSAANGIWPAFYAEMFSTKVRYSGMAIGTQIGFGIAGFAPTMAAAIANDGPHGWVPVAWLVSGGCILAALCAATARETAWARLNDLGKSRRRTLSLGPSGRARPDGDVGRCQGGMLCGALDDDPDRGPALLVPNVQDRAVGVALMRLAPLPKRHEHGPQVPSLAGQAVLVAHATARILVRNGFQDARRRQGAKPVTEDRFGQADMAPEFVEAVHAVAGIAQDQQRPLLPDQVERALDRAVLRAHLKPLHSTMVTTWLHY
jgi:hypothetical protein